MNLQLKGGTMTQHTEFDDEINDDEDDGWESDPEDEFDGVLNCRYCGSPVGAMELELMTCGICGKDPN